ncbi:MAG: 6-phosphogluconolactonase [Planctomycetota bacterium]|jgi:6-phosphogluconolactonase
MSPNESNPSETPVEGYGLSEVIPAAPDLPGQVVVAPDFDQLIDKIAADLVVHAENCVRQFGDFHLALSGGKTPQRLYERLMYDPNYRRLPWKRTQLWLVDERCVPLDDERSNFHVIGETIGEHADIPPEQVHPIFASSPDADIAYENRIKEALGWREKGQDRLDFILLILGADGHTAGLFPHTEPLQDQRRFVRFNATEERQPSERVTMTLPLINSARFIAILGTGSDKAAVLERIGAGGETIDDLPVTGVQPLNGELKWFLDADACGHAD